VTNKSRNTGIVDILSKVYTTKRFYLFDAETTFY